MADAADDGGGVAGGGSQADRKRLLAPPIEAESDRYLGDGLTTSDQAGGEIANQGPQYKGEGFDFDDGGGELLDEGSGATLAPRAEGGTVSTPTGEGMRDEYGGTEAAGQSSPWQVGECADGVDAQALEQGMLFGGKGQGLEGEGSEGCGALGGGNYGAVLLPVGHMERGGGVVGDHHMRGVAQLMHADSDPLQQGALSSGAPPRHPCNFGHHSVWWECCDGGRDPQ